MEKLCKIIIVGENGVGKTSYVRRLTSGCFTGHYKPTIGVEYNLLIHKLGDLTVKVQLWDIAGQDRYSAISRVFYRYADACLVMCDVSNRQTLPTAAVWKKEIMDKCCLPDTRPLPCILLANKTDLKPSSISSKEIEEFSKKHDFLTWFETSVKDCINTTESFVYIVNQCGNDYKDWKVNHTPQTSLLNFANTLNVFEEYYEISTKCHRAKCC